METASEHILELYPQIDKAIELRLDEFTYDRVCHLMESYARKRAVKFTKWSDGGKLGIEYYQREYDEWNKQTNQ